FNPRCRVPSGFLHCSRLARAPSRPTAKKPLENVRRFARSHALRLGPSTPPQPRSGVLAIRMLVVLSCPRGRGRGQRTQLRLISARQERQKRRQCQTEEEAEAEAEEEAS